MKRILILVEGQTEERFVKQVLQPHLASFDVHVTPTLVVTKVVNRGPNFKGVFRATHSCGGACGH